ncbi:hypothetical protein XELAEV_18046170mg [Xenopus laevis]|uniref:Uncharacterized protein n=1 Tax=Xenopus laevis TaxID=8355 RepID=A0A974H0C6_XENLA|nr:hypothetical protein XELAEV_18046170mg [Xenopus laevis]
MEAQQGKMGHNCYQIIAGNWNYISHNCPVLCYDSIKECMISDAVTSSDTRYALVDFALYPIAWNPLYSM